MISVRNLFAFAALTLLTVSSASADVRLSKVFGNHMVLQQNQPIRVWGWADAGEQVIVEIGGQTGTAKAGDDGKWRVDLSPMKADGKSHTMTVKGSNTIKLKDVLLGEVWICSGQSNMEWTMTGTLNAKDEIAAAKHVKIRLFNVPGHVAGPSPQQDTRGQWQICSPRSVPGFSAVGYFFGRAIQQQVKVPVGLIGTNWGGTRIEPWTPTVGFKQIPQLKDYVTSLESTDPTTPKGKANYQRYLDRVDTWLKKARTNLADGKPFGNPPRINVRPKGGATQIYNGMVHGLTPLSVRGAIWYQGESNAGDGRRYEHLKTALVKGWRTVFENDKLAFYWVQLANFQQPTNNPAGGGWGAVREGQRRALKIPHTGMAVIIDIGAARNIHPRNKQDVGKRLARWALANEYGKSIVPSGPLYKGMKKEGNKIRISFDHVGSGLMVAEKKGLAPAKATPDRQLKRWAIQDAAGKWHWAKAKIDGEAVLVWHDDVKNPKHVRFGYESNPVGINLYNKEGLPASPFTTD